MNAIDALGAVRDAVQQAQGDVVSKSAVLRLLNDVASYAARSSEDAQRSHDFQLVRYEADTQHSIEMFRSVMESGKEALNALILISGGASVALLSFLANRADAKLGQGLVNPLIAFGMAVLAGALSHGLRYLCQATYAGDWMKTGHAMTVLAVAAALAGYTLFGWGVWETAQSFRDFFTAMPPAKP